MKSNRFRNRGKPAHIHGAPLLLVACLATLAPGGGAAEEAAASQAPRAGDAPSPAAPSRLSTASDTELAGEMVFIPGGTFLMGGWNKEGSRHRPVRRITAPAFKMGKYEVTFAQWDAYVADSGCANYLPNDLGWGRGNIPVVNVSWEDAQDFIGWLNARTGGGYRLPTEAEWEYAARAGTTTAYPWGDEVGVNRANCMGCGSQWDDKQPAPVGSFPANGWGLHDMIGNAAEWVQDCFNYAAEGAPADGSAWVREGCNQRVMRGGSWYDSTNYLDSSHRSAMIYAIREPYTGFRLAQDL